MLDKMEVGKYNKLPHYAVHGEKTCMYLWVNEDGRGSASGWIKGNDAFRLWNKLQILFKKDKKEFIKLLKNYHESNKVNRCLRWQKD